MSSFEDAETGIEVCRDKLLFLCDAFSQPGVQAFELSEHGTSGLFLIIRETEEDLKKVATMAKGGVR